MCVLANVFLPRHDRGDDNLVKALIIIFLKEFLLPVLDILFIHFLFTNSGAAGMAGHMFRPSNGKVATVPHFCVHSALDEISVTASSASVCLYMAESKPASVCLYARMSRCYLQETRAFRLLIAQHATVSSCIVNLEQCNSLGTVV